MDTLRDAMKKYGFWLLWLALAAALLVRVRYCTAGEEESYFLAEANAYPVSYTHLDVYKRQIIKRSLV